MGRKLQVSVGDKFISDRYGEFTVIRAKSSKDIDVMFKDGTIVNTTSTLVAERVIRNLNFPTVFGVGFTGEGIYSKATHPNLYSKWASMISRGYNEKYKQKRPTYMDVIVDSNWHNFQNFAAWAIKRKDYKPDWQIDKDIIVPNNKTYGAKFCCFLPTELNTSIRPKYVAKDGTGLARRKDTKLEQYKVSYFIDNTYKTTRYFINGSEAYLFYVAEKNKRLKYLAEKYKGELDTEVYNKLSTINIEDYFINGNDTQINGS